MLNSFHKYGMLNLHSILKHQKYSMLNCHIYIIRHVETSSHTACWLAHYLTSMLNAYVSPDHVPIIQLYSMSFWNKIKSVFCSPFSKSNRLYTFENCEVLKTQNGPCWLGSLFNTCCGYLRFCCQGSCWSLFNACTGLVDLYLTHAVGIWHFAVKFSWLHFWSVQL